MQTGAAAERAYKQVQCRKDIYLGVVVWSLDENGIIASLLQEASRNEKYCVEVQASNEMETCVSAVPLREQLSGSCRFLGAGAAVSSQQESALASTGSVCWLTVQVQF